MPARSPTPLHLALRHLPAPRGLLTLDEIRARVDVSNDTFVWRCTAPDGRVARVVCTLHFTARRMGGRTLGVDPARIVARRVDETPITESDRPLALNSLELA